jgi:curved DNA-binding protein CbpA
MSSHHRILGVPANASLIQIKRAYFKKAKILHPDVNKSPNAMEDFVRLNMAYEALTNPRYVRPPIYTSRKKRKTKSPGEIKRDWVKKRNKELRELARKAVLKRKKASLESNAAFYRSFTFNIMCLISGLLFMVPAYYAYAAMGETDEIDNKAKLIISFVSFTIAFGLICIFLRYLFLKLFK